MKLKEYVFKGFTVFNIIVNIMVYLKYKLIQNGEVI
jgi:hypothetical protein